MRFVFLMLSTSFNTITIKKYGTTSLAGFNIEKVGKEHKSSKDSSLSLAPFPKPRKFLIITMLKYSIVHIAVCKSSH